MDAEELKKSKELPRRFFLNVFLGGLWSVATSVFAFIAGAATLAPLFKQDGGQWIRVASFAELGEEPKAFVVDHVLEQGWTRENRKTLVYAYLDAKRQPVILSSSCTHLGCAVRWNKKFQLFECPCHGGIYSEEGAVVDGPPPRDLARWPVKVENGTVLALRT
ncbi:MAG: ubiquinol-cytochrome c reductase iron-sulfur subunit [Acidobacteria bacterium]|nr:ubiquinol-cytochrome c reductase iron-sulfur subunit [Acidobacteriota bacterium]